MLYSLTSRRTSVTVERATRRLTDYNEIVGLLLFGIREIFVSTLTIKRMYRVSCFLVQHILERLVSTNMILLFFPSKMHGKVWSKVARCLFSTVTNESENENTVNDFWYKENAE